MSKILLIFYLIVLHGMEFGRIRFSWKCTINGTQNSARGCRSSRCVGSLWESVEFGCSGFGDGGIHGLILNKKSLLPLPHMLWDSSTLGPNQGWHLRNPLCAGSKAHKQSNLPWPWNPGQTSPKSPKQGFSGLTKMTYVFPKSSK